MAMILEPGIAWPETPFLAVDLDSMEANIARMRGAIIERAKLNWRPHVKAIKTPAIAHRLLGAGAIGVTCAKLGEAEVMARAGIRDILIANQIVTPSKMKRLAALNREARVIVAVDDAGNAQALGKAAEAAGTKIPVVVELDIGMQRAGVPPGPAALELVRAAVACDGLAFAGLMGWEGHATGIGDPAAKESAIRGAIGALVASAGLCRRAGFRVDIVSCGGTGTYEYAAAVPGITEIQAGGGIFCDVRYRSEYGVEHDYALSVWSTVVSRPTPTRVVCDAGWKAAAAYPTLPVPADIAARSVHLSAEYGSLELETPAAKPQIGDRMRWIVGYCDSTVFLHDALYALRRGEVEAVWPLEARGQLA